jgi:hypothetical protein
LTLTLNQQRQRFARVVLDDFDHTGPVRQRDTVQYPQFVMQLQARRGCRAIRLH